MDKRLGLLRTGLVIATVILIVLSGCLFMVKEGEAIISMRLGRQAKSVVEPGLYFRLPFPLEKLDRIDMRKRNVRSQHTEMLTRDNRNIILLSFDEELLFSNFRDVSCKGNEPFDVCIGTRCEDGIYILTKPN